jgi:Family of unknown function (DUF6159)
MFSGFAKSWELVKASWNVLRSDKELIVFPIISFIGVLVLSGVFAFPFITVGIAQGARGDDTGVTIAGYILLFVFYVIMYTIIFFCNTALVGAALIRLRGGDPTVNDGIQIAMRKINHIVGYALISATIGMILRAIAERGGIIGQIASSFIGLAWNIATFLVVPVLVVEDIGPMDAIKRSTSMLKQTWGEQLVGNFGMGAVFGILFFLDAFVFFGLFAFGISTESTALIVGAIIFFVASLVILSLISSTLSSIYQAAVYRFAAEGAVAEGFTPELVQGAFKEKNKR